VIGFVSPLKYESGSTDPNQCNRPMDEESVLNWIKQNVNAGTMLGGKDSSD
jgi:hypothetical protein